MLFRLCVHCGALSVVASCVEGGTQYPATQALWLICGSGFPGVHPLCTDEVAHQILARTSSHALDTTKHAPLRQGGQSSTARTASVAPGARQGHTPHAWLKRWQSLHAARVARRYVPVHAFTAWVGKGPQDGHRFRASRSGDRFWCQSLGRILRLPPRSCYLH